MTAAAMIGSPERGFFVSAPVLEWNPASVANRFILVEPLRYHRPEGFTVTVPAGFGTDLASIPAMFRGIIDREGPILPPAIVHDYLYRVGNHNDCDFLGFCGEFENLQKIISEGMHLEIRSRKWADETFLLGMISTNTGFFDRMACYYAVRLFGKSSFRVGVGNEG